MRIHRAAHVLKPSAMQGPLFWLYNEQSGRRVCFCLPSTRERRSDKVFGTGGIFLSHTDPSKAGALLLQFLSSATPVPLSSSPKYLHHPPLTPTHVATWRQPQSVRYSVHCVWMCGIKSPGGAGYRAAAYRTTVLRITPIYQTLYEEPAGSLTGTESDSSTLRSRMYHLKRLGGHW